MSRLGGLCRMPMTLGGGTSAENSIYQTLKDGAGDGYISQDDSALINIENAVAACGISRAQAQNRSAINNAFAQLATWSLPWWERHLNISPSSGATEPQRRSAIVAAAMNSGVPIRDRLNAVLRAGLNDPTAQVIAGTIPKVLQRLPAPSFTVSSDTLGGSLAAGQYAIACCVVDESGNVGFPSDPQFVTTTGATSQLFIGSFSVDYRAKYILVYMSQAPNDLNVLLQFATLPANTTGSANAAVLPSGTQIVGLLAPPQPTLGSYGTGGQLAAGQYAVGTAFVDSGGLSWSSCAPVSITISAGKTVLVSPTPLAYAAVAVRYYFSTSVGEVANLAYVGENNGSSFAISALPSDAPACVLHSETALITSTDASSALLAKELLGPMLPAWVTINIVGGGAPSPFILGTVVPPASPLGTGIL